jgi:hypothetical protein
MVGRRTRRVVEVSASGLAGERSAFEILFTYWIRNWASALFIDLTSRGFDALFPLIDQSPLPLTTHCITQSTICVLVVFFTGVFLLDLANIISYLYNKENYTKIIIYSCNLRGLLCVSRDSFNICILFMYFNTGPSSSITFMFTVLFAFLPSPVRSYAALRVQGR